MNPRPADHPAAPLDRHARLLLVAWLGASFALVCALLALATRDDGLLAAWLALLCGTLPPLLVLWRVAGLPAAFRLRGDRIEVRRLLLPARTFTVTGEAAAEPRAGMLRRRATLLGLGYGVGSLRWRSPDGGRPVRLQLATTDLDRVVRVGTTRGPLLASPADPEAFASAVRAVGSA